MDNHAAGKPMFKRVKAGDSPSASEYNKLLALVEELARRLPDGTGGIPKLKFVELNSDLPGGPIELESSGSWQSGLSQDSAESVEEYVDKSGIVLGWDALAEQWVDSGLDVDNITNCFPTPYFAGERLWVLSDPQSGKHVPMSPCNIVRLGKTVGTISADGFGTVEFYAGEHGNEERTGIIVRVFDRYQDLENRVWVHLVFQGEGWDLLAGDCDDPGESDSSGSPQGVSSGST